MVKNSRLRLLLYSADNAGIGHSSIGISLLSGLRAVCKEIEFLVISPTGTPQRFLSNEIEVIKIPSLKPLTENMGANFPYIPRYLKNSSIQECMHLRQGIIDAVFTAYAPSVLLIDHHVIGLNGELVPWLLKKQMGYLSFICAYLSRGIISSLPVIEPPFKRITRGITFIDLAEVFDKYFIFEDQENLQSSFFNLSQVPRIQPKVEFVGKMAMKNHDELLPREDIWHRLNLPLEKEMIVANLGHGLYSERILESITYAFYEMDLKRTHVLLVVVSPYLNTLALTDRKLQYSKESIIVSEYLEYFIDILKHADLAICRAGYNTVVELMMTGCRAIVIPEDYGSLEQTHRANMLSDEGFISLDPDTIDVSTMKKSISNLLNQTSRPSLEYSRQKIAERVLDSILKSQ
ncbi:MAG: hypothetical protein GY861_11175 [bacterium]|nr:hypothetical protein [bacterium]